MGVPYQNVDMTKHQQHVVVRNERGREMLEVLGSRLEKTPTSSQGDRRSVVMQVGCVMIDHVCECLLRSKG